MPRKPVALSRGDLVGVISPGAAVDERVVISGVHVLEAAGLRVRLGRAALARSGYLAGPDHERLADLHDMFRDPDVRGILTTRGGYGSGRLLPGLDLPLIAAHPKIFVGYSDITFLLNHFLQRADLVTFHGPLVADLHAAPEAAQALLNMLYGDRVGWQALAPMIIQPGTAEGMVVGGCLSIVTAALGTPYAVDVRDRLLFLEEVNEKPFRIDRMLTQLRQAGVLDHVAGVIFGEMVGCTAGEGERVTVHDVIASAFAQAPYPVVCGLPTGHGAGGFTLPIGVRARLAGDRLTLLESPLVE